MSICIFSEDYCVTTSLSQSAAPAWIFQKRKYWKGREGKEDFLFQISWTDFFPSNFANKANCSGLLLVRNSQQPCQNHFPMLNSHLLYCAKPQKAKGLFANLARFSSWNNHSSPFSQPDSGPQLCRNKNIGTTAMNRSKITLCSHVGPVDHPATLARFQIGCWVSLQLSTVKLLLGIPARGLLLPEIGTELSESVGRRDGSSCIFSILCLLVFLRPSVSSWAAISV